MDEPEYVIVTKSLDENAEHIELPTEQDNTLGLQTLVGAFPGAHGLKYKNPVTGAFRALLMDNAGAKFYPPPDGWTNKVFLVLSKQPEEKKYDNDLPGESTIARCRKYMLYALIEKCEKTGAFIEGQTKSCVTVAHKKYAFMAGHCVPKGFPKGETFTVYESAENHYEVRLFHIEREEDTGNDFAILEIVHGEFPKFPLIENAGQGNQYFILGYHSDYLHAKLSFFRGFVQNACITVNQNYIIGSPGATRGCSGGGVFSLNGDLYGICVSGPRLSVNDQGTLPWHLENLHFKLGEPSYCHIVPANCIMACLYTMKMVEQAFSDDKKKMGLA